MKSLLDDHARHEVTDNADNPCRRRDLSDGPTSHHRLGSRLPHSVSNPGTATPKERSRRDGATARASA